MTRRRFLLMTGASLLLPGCSQEIIGWPSPTASSLAASQATSLAPAGTVMRWLQEQPWLDFRSVDDFGWPTGTFLTELIVQGRSYGQSGYEVWLDDQGGAIDQTSDEYRSGSGISIDSLSFDEHRQSLGISRNGQLVFSHLPQASGRGGSHDKPQRY